jgi:hypothetical protein
MRREMDWSVLVRMAPTREDGPMQDEVRFRSDLYAGAAEYYERYRPSYPPQLLARLVEKVGVSGHGRLLDLACGTGQVAFGLCSHFEQVWTNS